MVDAPQQDWQAFVALTREEEAQWVRQLSTAERFAIYSDAFNIIRSVPRAAGDLARLEKGSWEQKRAMRQRLLQVYTILDRSRCESAAANNAR